MDVLTTLIESHSETFTLLNLEFDSSSPNSGPKFRFARLNRIKIQIERRDLGENLFERSLKSFSSCIPNVMRIVNLLNDMLLVETFDSKASSIMGYDGPLYRFHDQNAICGCCELVQESL